MRGYNIAGEEGLRREITPLEARVASIILKAIRIQRGRKFGSRDGTLRK
ncbi:MAG: hypothetical protein Q9N34_03415 [Aquificota bacterium]|nr:hypothetical protein [Aquificota bacterium]